MEMKYSRKIKYMFFLISSFVLLSQIEIPAQNHDKQQTGNISFEQTAQKLTNTLREKLNLTQDQADDIKSSLIDYNKRIHEKEKNFKDEDKDESLVKNSELTGNAESHPELMKEFEKVDNDANKDIEKTLNKDQLKKYIKIKDAWWNNVKNDVFSFKNSNRNTGENDKNTKAIGNINKDLINRNDNDTTGMDERFQKNAKALSISLMKKIDLSLKQVSDIKDILVDYQKDIYDTQGKNLSGENNNQYNGTNTIPNTKDRDNDKVQLTGGDNKLTDDLKKADKNTNDSIEKVLNKNQLKEYLNYKDAWWKEIKDKVYSRDSHKHQSMSNKYDK